MDRNRWLIFAGLCVVIIGGLVMFSTKDKVDVSSTDGNKINTTAEITDHVIGKTDAKIVVMEYADYQCPGCHGAYPQMKSISDQYKDSVAFVYRNFPLTSAHPHAFAAAATAEAAGIQGKYWEMHDLLFSTQDNWSSLTAEKRATLFESYATQLGLTLDQFRSDLTSKKVADKINTDRALGVKAGVDATPTLYINGSKVDTTITSDVIGGTGDKLRALLDEKIRSIGGTPPVTTQTTTDASTTGQ